MRNPSRARWRIVAAALALAAASHAASSGPEQAEQEARLRAWLRAAVAARHLRAEHVDVDGIVREVGVQLATMPSDEKLREWAWGRAMQQFYSFASADARHDLSARYRLPFEPNPPRLCTQAPGGKLSHADTENLDAVDFALPLGTPVLVAREGVVARVVDGFAELGEPAERGSPGNHVIVLHADGTFATYAHLSPGIAVSEGQTVAAEVPLGASGATGYALGPHLHFVVSRLGKDGRSESVPVRFGTAAPTGFVPQAGQFYGAMAPGWRPCGDLAIATPASPSGALQRFLPTFRDFACRIRRQRGFDHFEALEEPGGGTLRVRVTRSWPALYEENRRREVAQLVAFWKQANLGSAARIELVDAAGKPLPLPPAPAP